MGVLPYECNPVDHAFTSHPRSSSDWTLSNDPRQHAWCSAERPLSSTSASTAAAVGRYSCSNLVSTAESVAPAARRNEVAAGPAASEAAAADIVSSRRGKMAAENGLEVANEIQHGDLQARVADVAVRPHPDRRRRRLLLFARPLPRLPIVHHTHMHNTARRGRIILHLFRRGEMPPELRERGAPR